MELVKKAKHKGKIRTLKLIEEQRKKDAFFGELAKEI
jgi:hypothetical protein